jgi:hypothetical protein
VLGALAVGPLHLGIRDRRLDDAGLQVVEDDLTRDPTEELEGVAVQRKPRPDRLVLHELHVLVTAVRERHNEDPGLRRGLARRPRDEPRVPEVDLCLLAGADLDPHDCAAGPLVDVPPHEASDRGVARAHVGVRRREPLPGDLDLQPGADERADLLAVSHEARRRLDGLGAGEPLVELGRGRQRRLVAGQELLRLEPGDILANRVAADTEPLRHCPRAFSEAQPSQHLADIEHVASPPCHPRPPGQKARSGTRPRLPQGARRPSARLSAAAASSCCGELRGGSVTPPLGWISMGDHGWITLPAPGWISLGAPDGSPTAPRDNTPEPSELPGCPRRRAARHPARTCRRSRGARHRAAVRLPAGATLIACSNDRSAPCHRSGPALLSGAFVAARVGIPPNALSLFYRRRRNRRNAKKNVVHDHEAGDSAGWSRMITTGSWSGSNRAGLPAESPPLRGAAGAARR